MALSIPITDLFAAQTAEEWNTFLLASADTLKLRTSAWQAGAITRTIFAVVSQALMLEDVAVSLLTMGGFLDYAATGSITYTDATGATVTVYVTPDPSDPGQNPEGALGALDVLADSVYDVRRDLATAAGGSMAILNTTATTYTFTPGTYHVAQPNALGNPSYANVDALTFGQSPTVGTVSSATNVTPIAITTSAPHGLTTGATVFIAGVTGNLAANGAWVATVTGAATFTLDGSVGSGSYVSGGTVYTPTLAPFAADARGTASNAVTGNLITQAVTSLVGVSVSNPGPFLGSDTESNPQVAVKCRLKLQSISVGGPRGAYLYFAIAAYALASSVPGAGTLSTPINRAVSTVDPLTGTVFTTVANAAGTPSAADVLVVDAVEQANAVPNGVTAVTQAAVAHNLAVVVNAWIPAAYVSAATAVIQVAVQVFSRLFRIGGVNVTGQTGTGPTEHVVPINSVEGAVNAALFAARIPVTDLQVTLDGALLNVELALTPIPEVAVLSPALPTVNVVAT